MPFLKRPEWLKGKLDEEAFMQAIAIPAANMTVAAQPPPIEKAPELVDKYQVIAQAHHFVDELRRREETMKAEIDKLKGDMAELVLILEAEKRKSHALEVGLLTAANDKQALQSQITEYRQLHSLTRGLWDKWEIKPPPKKERNHKPKTVAKLVVTKRNAEGKPIEGHVGASEPENDVGS
jgi:hypothetical protein